jgi:hypothetical protein
VIVESSLTEGELGYLLLGAVLKTLYDRETLDCFRGVNPHRHCANAAFERYEGAPWLKIGDHRWEAWSSEIITQCYEILSAQNTMDPQTLDLWIRAVGGESKDFWELHRLCVSRELMASLVERGGNPLRALKIG